jgi:preprotein translocase subunit SecG
MNERSMNGLMGTVIALVVMMLIAWLLPTNWSTFLFNIAILLLGVFMILLILIQRGKGGGLAGAFGGAGGSSAFGSRAGDAFTRLTIYVATVWFLMIMVQIRLVQPAVAAPERPQLGEREKTPEKDKDAADKDKDAVDKDKAEKDKAEAEKKDKEKTEPEKKDKAEPEKKDKDSK